MSRVRLPFTPELEVEFCDRFRGIKQVIEWGERSTRFPIVVFGPEGCGKTAWLIQAIEVLKELEFEVIYFNPLRR
ncbi:MAG: ATP-binding protein, partial [Sulfolobales archaeon]